MSFIAALLLSVASAQDETARKIDELIRQLGADEFSVREKAAEELRKIGKPAEEALKKAAESSDDPEVRERARAALEALNPKPKAAPPPRGAPGFNFGPGGGRGGSVTVQTVNGDSTYRITPGDGTPGITFRKDKEGAVKLEYSDDKGESKTAESESVAKFLKDHPELAGKYGITEEGIAYGGARVGFKGGFAFPAPFPRAPFRPRAVLPPELDREPLRAGGASFETVEEALRTQLDLPEGQGLVVTKVEEGSVAESAGLKKSDILLEIDGRRVSSIRDVKEHLQKTSSSAVLRRGKRETVGAGAPKKDY